MDKKYVLVCVIVALAAGAALDRKFNPPRVETSTQIKDNIITRTIVIKQPDGTIVTQIDKNEQVKKDIQQIIQTTQTQWRAGLGAGVNLDLKPVYSLDVDRRLAGPLWIGATVTTERVGLVRLSFEF